MDASTFWSRTRKTTSGCLEWLGWKDRLGYGRVYFSGRSEMAHRFALRLLKRTVPRRLTVDHLCRNTSCVNPEHLEVVPHRINVLRGIGPTAINAKKSRCLRGHTLSGPNLRLLPDGRRTCVICVRACCRKAMAKYRRALGKPLDN